MAPRTKIGTSHIHQVFHTPAELTSVTSAFKSIPTEAVQDHVEQQMELFASQSRWLSVKALAHQYRDVTSEQALRSLIWEAEAYEKHPKSGLKSNGFLPVIVRPPNQRKVLLDRAEFEKWLTSRQRA